MDLTQKIAWFFIDLILPLVVGFALRGRVHVEEKTFEKVMLFDLIVIVSVLCALSFWNAELELKLIWLPPIAALTVFAPGYLGTLRAKAKYSSPLDQGGYALAAFLSNRNTAGTITVFLLLGEAGYAYSRLYAPVNWILVYLFCFPMANAYRAKGLGDAGQRPPLWKVLFDRKQIPLLGIAAGALLNCSGLERPEVVERVFPWLVHLSAWMFLVPLGYSIDIEEMRNVSHDWSGILFLKFIFTPLVAYVAGKLVGLEGPVLYTVVILSSSPSAIQSVIISRLTGLNSHIAMGAFILTMVTYLVIVVPIIFAIVGMVM